MRGAGNAGAGLGFAPGFPFELIRATSGAAFRPLGPVAEHLTTLLPGVPVHFVAACVGGEAEAAAAALRPGEILVLENLRFHPEES